MLSLFGQVVLGIIGIASYALIFMGSGAIVTRTYEAVRHRKYSGSVRLRMLSHLVIGVAAWMVGMIIFGVVWFVILKMPVDD